MRNPNFISVARCLMTHLHPGCGSRAGVLGPLRSPLLQTRIHLCSCLLFLFSKFLLWLFSSKIFICFLMFSIIANRVLQFSCLVIILSSHLNFTLNCVYTFQFFIFSTSHLLTFWPCFYQLFKILSAPFILFFQVYISVDYFCSFSPFRTFHEHIMKYKLFEKCLKLLIIYKLRSLSPALPWLCVKFLGMDSI